jgi:hypothetical protein
MSDSGSKSKFYVDEKKYLDKILYGSDSESDSESEYKYDDPDIPDIMNAIRFRTHIHNKDGFLNGKYGLINKNCIYIPDKGRLGNFDDLTTFIYNAKSDFTFELSKLQIMGYFIKNKDIPSSYTCMDAYMLDCYILTHNNSDFYMYSFDFYGDNSCNGYGNINSAKAHLFTDWVKLPGNSIIFMEIIESCSIS